MTSYSIEICSPSHPDVEEYYRVRAEAYHEKLDQDCYDEYPTEHDSRLQTKFLIFKIQDADGKEIVFGGRRLVFPDQAQIGTLPFEHKHKVLEEKRASADRFPVLRGKDYLDIMGIIPALRTDVEISCAELGGFAIDQNTTRKHFDKSEYIRIRQEIYKASLAMAREVGADIVIIGPHRNNLKNQIDWLKADGKYEFRRLYKTQDLFTNPLPPGMESEILVINVSDKYKLLGPASVLRADQLKALKFRDPEWAAVPVGAGVGR